MARATGPLLGAGASGTIGDLVTFSTSRGRVSVKMKSPGPGTNTPAQRSVRAIMSFLNIGWNGFALNDPLRTAWSDLTQDQTISGINNYLRFNLDRWTDFKSPMVASSPLAGPGPPTFSGITGFIGAKDQFTANYNLTNLRQGWGVAVFIDPGTVTPPQRTQLAHVDQLTTTGLHTITIHKIPKGAYNGILQSFDQNGNRFTVGTSHGFTVT
jgi:hypothetical protein